MEDDLEEVGGVGARVRDLATGIYELERERERTKVDTLTDEGVR